MEENFHIEENESIGFVFPVYAWAPPKIVIDFIKRMNIDKPKYLYFVCTCGDDTGKTAYEFKKNIQNKGWECHAGYSVTMPNTYVSLPGFDVDEATIAKQKIENAIARIDYISKEIQARRIQEKPDCHEGAFPRLKTYVLKPMFYQFLMSPKAFYTNENCTSCKRCEKICPLHNIQTKDKPHWGNQCAHCLACYHACPVRAIQYGKFTKEKGQYKGVHSLLE